MSTEKDPTKVITPVGVLSYPHLFTAQKAQEEGKKDKFGATVIFFPTGADLSRYDEATAKMLANADLKPLQEAAAAAAVAKWGDKAMDMFRRNALKSPFRKEGDSYGTSMAEKGYPEGCVFINVRSDSRPQVVSRLPGPDGKPQIIVDAGAVYPGCLVRVSVRAFGYDVSGNKGVSFGLNNVQKWAEGPRMDKRMDASAEFDADLTAAPANLDDVTGFGV
jgi:hypothetical protein